MKVSPLFTTADNEITLESIADGVFMGDSETAIEKGHWQAA